MKSDTRSWDTKYEGQDTRYEVKRFEKGGARYEIREVMRYENEI